MPERHEVPSNRDTGAAAEIEHLVPLRAQTFNKAAEPFLANGGNPEPLDIGIRDLVITCGDQTFGIRVHIEILGG